MQAFQVSFLEMQVFIKNSLAAKKSAGMLVCWSQATHGLKSVVEKLKLSCILFDCTALCLFSQSRIVNLGVTNKVLFGTISTSLQFLLEIKMKIGRNCNYCW